MEDLEHIKVIGESGNIDFYTQKEEVRKLLSKVGKKENLKPVKEKELENLIELIYWIKQYYYSFSNYNLDYKETYLEIVKACIRGINKAVRGFYKIKEEEGKKDYIGIFQANYLEFYPIASSSLLDRQERLIRILKALKIIKDSQNNLYEFDLKTFKEIDSNIYVLDICNINDYILYKVI